MKYDNCFKYSTNYEIRLTKTFDNYLAIRVRFVHNTTIKKHFYKIQFTILLKKQHIQQKKL